MKERCKKYFPLGRIVIVHTDISTFSGNDETFNFKFFAGLQASNGLDF